MNLIIVIHKMSSDTPISWNDPSNTDTLRLIIVIFLMTQPRRKPSSITAIILDQLLTSLMTRVTSHNMTLTCRMASYLSMNIVVARTCHTSSTARRWMQKLACTTMVQGT